MALRDITNKQSKFRLHVDLDGEYATLRSTQRDAQLSTQQLRMQGCKAIDLWTDGRHYPIDPLSSTHPPFQTMASMIRFIRDGWNGLLGYCIRLHSQSLNEAAQRMQMQSALNQSNAKVHELIERIKALLEKESELKLNMEERKKSFQRVSDNYVRLQYSTRNMRRRIDHFTNLPMGYHARQRKQKALDDLAKSGGAHKRRVRATREVAIALMGCQNTDKEARISLLKNFIRPQDILDMISNPSNSKTVEMLQKHFFQKLNAIVTARDMLDVCDAAGISRKGYEGIYRIITLGLRAKGFTASMLPTSYCITMAKKSANRDIASVFGGFKWVEESMPMSAFNSFQYDTFNNVYIDMEPLQRAMIQFYGLTFDECKGKAIFVLKLDECQLYKLLASPLGFTYSPLLAQHPCTHALEEDRAPGEGNGDGQVPPQALENPGPKVDDFFDFSTVFGGLGPLPCVDRTPLPILNPHSQPLPNPSKVAISIEQERLERLEEQRQKDVEECERLRGEAEEAQRIQEEALKNMQADILKRKGESKGKEKPSPSKDKQSSKKQKTKGAPRWEKQPPPPPPPATKKKYRFKPGTVALREIKKYQKTTEPIIPKAPFSRVVREIMEKVGDRATRIQARALNALQEASEAILVSTFEDSVLCMAHAKRVTINSKDMGLALALRQHPSLDH
ncbi:hypothetical protein L7F22_020891 [Adiantum nelumboides]|nr:hypothetical protein [Adiantum nelumboides]